MSKNTKSKPSAYLTGKEDFGFKSDSEIAKLKTCLITVDVHLGNAPCQEIIHHTPKERLKIRAEWFKENFYQLIKLPIFEKIIAKKLAKPHASFTATLQANQLSKLLREKNIWYVSLLEIDGIRKKKQRPKKSLDWYAVKGIYAIQVEDQTKGLQSFEERILLVKATSFDDAEKKAWKESKTYVESYLNPYGEMVRWQLEKIVNVYWTDIEELNPNGTEVFSALKDRRMKPEYEWHPAKKMNHV